jgi:hypothetical protein
VQLRGDYEAMKARAQEALDAYGQTGDVLASARATNLLARAEALGGDADRAGSLFARAVELAARSEDEDSRFALQRDLAYFVMHYRDLEHGVGLMEELLGVARRRGKPRAVATCLFDLGGAAIEQGRYHAALDNLQESLRIWAHGGSKVSILGCLPDIVHAAAKLGRCDAAMRLLAVVDRLYDEIGMSLEPGQLSAQEETRTECRASLGHDASERARIEGKAMTFEDAVAYALALAPPNGPGSRVTG